MLRCLSIIPALLVCQLGCTVASGALADAYLTERIPRRLVLVVANSEYKDLPDLPGVQADSVKMIEVFKDLGFDEVVHAPNVPTWDEFQYKVLKPFKAKIQPDDLVVVYFSGHGFSYAGYQYFAPAEMSKTVRAGKVAYAAIPVETLPEVFHNEGAGAALIIVDACRTIADFVVEDNAGRAVPKGQNNGSRKSPSSNYILALSVGNGLPAQASTDAGKMSVYTEALSGVILEEAEKDFRLWHDDVEYEVAHATDDAQVPGLHEFTMTDIVLKMSDAWRKGERIRWEAVLQSNDYAKVRKFARKFTLSPYVEQARRWLSEHEEMTVTARTPVSPVGVEYAWDANASVEAMSSVLNFPREVDYSQYRLGGEASLAGYGLRSEGENAEPTAFQLNEWSDYIASVEDVLAGKELEMRAAPAKDSKLVEIVSPADPLVTNYVTFREIPDVGVGDVSPRIVMQKNCTIGFCFEVPVAEFGEGVLDVRKPEQGPTTWVQVMRPGKTTGWLSLDMTNSSFDVTIGEPFEEIVTGQLEGAPSGVVDDKSFETVFQRAATDNTRISWASISVPSTSEEGDVDVLVATTTASLERLGLDREKITAVYSDPSVEAGRIRIRLFAQQ